MMTVQLASSQRSGRAHDAAPVGASTNTPTPPKGDTMHEPIDRPMQETGLGSVPKKDIYTYAEASQDFQAAKSSQERDAYKQFMVGDTQLHAESVKTSKGATLTRYETGAILKEEDKKPITISTPSGFVIESDLMTKDDVQEELADVAKVVKAQDPHAKNMTQAIETQFEHSVAEAEIWGKTLKDPDSVKIDPESENIDVSTPTGVFHLNKKDEITFDRADGEKQIALKQVLKEVPEASKVKPSVRPAASTSKS